MRIYEQKHGNWNEKDRLELATLLIKAGFTVRIGREKPPGKASAPYKHYVEYEER